MGYGAAGNATLDVDIVQTDVDAIVDGLAGGSTLSDLQDRLADIDGNLFDFSGGLSTAELLTDIKALLAGIKAQTDQLTFYGDELAVITSGMP